MHANRPFLNIPAGVSIALICVLLLTAVAPRRLLGAQTAWRLQIRDAAVVRGPMVLLGEIAQPVGQLDQETWQRLAVTALFPAPDKSLRPMSISRDKLAQALNAYLGEQARYCILPTSIAIQRGGGIVPQQKLLQIVVNSLTPKARQLGGEPEFRDFRLPDNVFLRDPTNTVQVDVGAAALKPGRNPLRITEVAMDGSVQRGLSGSVYLDLWKMVPAAARPLNRGDVVNNATMTMERKNLAYLRSDVWDGHGGPWRVKSALGKGEVIYMADLDAVPLISKGDVVQLVYNGPNVHLQVPALAMADGGFDQNIPVRNVQSQVQVYARVVDAKTVQVF